MIPYPLQWPDNMPRYQRTREAGQFRTTLPAAIKNVKESLRLFGSDSNKPLSNVVISSNYTLGADKPTDPGVSIWFVWDGMSVCIPVDRYSKVEVNLQAIHHILEARRVELRHGTLSLVRASFAGFTALPAPTKRTWQEILGIGPGVVPVTVAIIEDQFRRLAKKCHPDAGGSNELMAELNQARAAALREIGS